MTLNKRYEYDYEIRGPYRNIQIRQSTIIEEDGQELSRKFHRRVITCCTPGKNGWTDTDISNEPAEIQDLCRTLWTDEIRTAYREKMPVPQEPQPLQNEEEKET